MGKRSTVPIDEEELASFVSRFEEDAEDEASLKELASLHELAVSVIKNSEEFRREYKRKQSEDK